MLLVESILISFKRFAVYVHQVFLLPGTLITMNLYKDTGISVTITIFSLKYGYL